MCLFTVLIFFLFLSPPLLAWAALELVTILFSLPAVTKEYLQPLFFLSETCLPNIAQADLKHGTLLLLPYYSLITHITGACQHVQLFWGI